jgi:hypothetical protein
MRPVHLRLPLAVLSHLWMRTLLALSGPHPPLQLQPLYPSLPLPPNTDLRQTPIHNPSEKPHVLVAGVEPTKGEIDMTLT